MTTRVIAAIGLLFALGGAVNAQSFVATLTGGQENPPSGSTGTGSGSAVYNAGADTLTVHLDFSGLGSNAQDAHIHCCTTTDMNTSVAIGFTNPALGFPFGVTSGTFDHVFDLADTATYTAGFLGGPGGGTAAGARDALLAAFSADPLNPASSRAYFNIHTPNFPGGEIRGNIMPIPEPSTLLLLLCGMAAIALRRRTR